ncbi:hypothetical protein J3458_014338 [Metarhizium acridum]|uniref:uncharacterized protein n=1 Tax=Metarhizium acridum TaxID=92637 RepID=UPI001C6CABF5|nr:hypothetical protein J3458_014338 [Metarhizium acridum]
MNSAKRKCPPPPLKLHSFQAQVGRRSPGQRTLSPSPTTSSRRTGKLTGARESPTLQDASPTKFIFISPRPQSSTAFTTSPLKIAPPTVTITAILQTVTVTAAQQNATSKITTLSTVNPTAAGNGSSATAGNVIPPTASGFLIGVSGVSGGLLGIGAVLFLWRRRAKLKEKGKTAAP